MSKCEVRNANVESKGSLPADLLNVATWVAFVAQTTECAVCGFRLWIGRKPLRHSHSTLAHSHFVVRTCCPL